MTNDLQLTAHTKGTIRVTCTRPTGDPSWSLEDATGLVWMAKARATDDDDDAILTLELGDGIAVADATTAVITVSGDDWPDESIPDVLRWGLMSREGGEREQLATGSLTVLTPIPTEAPA